MNPPGRLEWRAGTGCQRGSITVLAAAMLLMLGVLALGVADVGRVLAARERAQTAADASALAAADLLALPTDETPAEAAVAEAEINGAVVDRCTCDEGSTSVDVEVSVSVAGFHLLPGVHVVRATARAVVDTAGSSPGLPTPTLSP